MSIVTRPEAPRGGPHQDDPFRYGWRYQKLVGPDGKEQCKQIPLTLEDVHHPQEEDFIVQRGGHAEDCIYLHDVLRTHLGDAALVTFDLRIAWATPEVAPLGPDVTVIFGAVFEDRGTYDCAAEGRTPTVVFEVVSPDTRNNDVNLKVAEYFLAGVPWYVIIDALGFRDGQWDLRVIGYRRTVLGYTAVELDERDWLWVEPLRVYVAVRGGRVVCYNEAGEELLNHRRLNDARLEAEQQRRAAELLVDAERQQRLDAERARLLSEQQRDTERRQREAAEQEKETLAERVRQMEAELSRLRGAP